MDAAVVDEIDAEDFMACRFQNGCRRHADAVITDMAEMLRLVRVWCGEFDENLAAFRFGQFHIGDNLTVLFDRVALEACGGDEIGVVYIVAQKAMDAAVWRDKTGMAIGAATQKRAAVFDGAEDDMRHVLLCSAGAIVP